MFIAAAVLILVVLAGLAVGREIVRSNYYVSEHDGTVSIMRGVQGSFLGLSLQEPYLLGCLNDRNELSLISAGQSRDDLDCRLLGVDDMRPSERAQVIAGLPVGHPRRRDRQIEELARSSVLPPCPPRRHRRRPPRHLPAAAAARCPTIDQSARRKHRPPSDVPAHPHPRRRTRDHPARRATPGLTGPTARRRRRRPPRCRRRRPSRDNCRTVS